MTILKTIILSILFAFVPFTSFSHELFLEPTQESSISEGIHRSSGNKNGENFRQPHVQNSQNSKTVVDITEQFSKIRFQSTSESHYTELFKKTFGIMPQNRVKTLQNVVLKDDSEDPYRGLGGSRTIIINTNKIDSDTEFSAVLVHEMCHIMDLGGLTGSIQSEESDFKDGSNPIYIDDPSVIFYSISWKNNSDKADYINEKDFVSGYAKSDPFEDMAESCTYYVLHNKNFRNQAEGNTVLAQKYQWLKQYVFNGKEYDTGNVSFLASINARSPWDITLLSYNMQSLFDQFEYKHIAKK